MVALGSRRFTLFPPAATADLYVGPFNHTPRRPAGQPCPIRCGPTSQPTRASPAALEAALHRRARPGDAVFIPTLWWHHVAALDPVNVLVNYWYNDIPRGDPFIAFIHALSAIRDLPEPQREAWRAWFDHFVFGPDAADAASHHPRRQRKG